MRIYHTHFGVPLGIAPSWWNDRQISHKPVLPLYLCLDISDNLSRALSCLCLSGHNVLVQRMRHNRNRRPSYFLWAQNLWLAHCSGWGIHFTGLSDEHLVSLRTQHRQLVFPLQNEDGPTRLKTFVNQPDIYGVASFVAECLALYPLNYSSAFPGLVPAGFSKLPLSQRHMMAM